MSQILIQTMQEVAKRDPKLFGLVLVAGATYYLARRCLKIEYRDKHREINIYFNDDESKAS